MCAQSPISWRKPQKPGAAFILASIAWLVFTSDVSIATAPVLLAENVAIEMYQLDHNGASLEIPCASGDTYYGCTAFAGDSSYAYPYSTDKPNVSIETDYLLDVVAKEMSPDPYSEPAALHAQAIASRSLVNYYINNPPKDGTPPDDPLNNSSKYQVFIPYQFERLGNSGQQLVSTAVASGHYVASGIDNPQNLAAKTLFAADILAETDDATWDKPYFVGVPDPISTACDADDEAVNQYGMSQQGASRWARGHECSYPDAPLSPGNPAGSSWSVRWEHAGQILTHYYSNVHIHDPYGDRLTPEYRWAPLQIDWHTADNSIPVMEHGTGYPVTFQIQNTGVITWVGTGQIALIYHGWDVAGKRQLSRQPEPYALLEITEPVPPGATAEDSITLYPPIPPQPGSAYRLRFEMGLWQPPDDWVGFSTVEAGYPWPTYDVTVCVGGPCREQVFLPMLTRQVGVTR